ncbi:MAG: bifunctional phosphopantothenoylcysteine decarboxylase/phosphopantothenate--cysteine ligase CoaBC [Acetobacteraceae bacterium]
MQARLAGRRVLLIVSGGIAAYKALELVRLLRAEGCSVSAVVTGAGEQFISALSLQALTESPVSRDLFSLDAESRMGHIALSRAADLLVVAPASADLIARMAAGLADDLAATLLLATDKPVLMAPAMNVRMWQHAATIANVAALEARGVARIGPEEGAMACNEYGPGRLAEPPAIVEAIVGMLAGGPLAGRRALVTSGPTHEPVDPVRFIANRSSGRQGHAIAAALAAAGASVTLITGPVALPDPAGVAVERVETAAEMSAACRAALPVDVAVLAAAVGDWRSAEVYQQKLKKSADSVPLTLALKPNPDILAGLAAPGPERPRLVIGFAAETESLRANAQAKLARKGCDWIIANDVGKETGVMGGEENTVLLVSRDGVEEWPRLAKTEVARRLVRRIAEALE